MTSMNTKRANKALHPTAIPQALHGGGRAWLLGALNSSLGTNVYG
jgi:hypothetical protein